MTSPAPVAPVVQVSLDKASYNVGDPITVTAAYTDPSAETSQLTVTVTVTDPSTGLVGTAEATAQVSTGVVPTLPAAASDNFGTTYAEQSNSAGTAVFTGQVPAPPAGA